jgi:hypothetical protein
VSLNLNRRNLVEVLDQKRLWLMGEHLQPGQKLNQLVDLERWWEGCIEAGCGKEHLVGEEG